MKKLLGILALAALALALCAAPALAGEQEYNCSKCNQSYALSALTCVPMDAYAGSSFTVFHGWLCPEKHVVTVAEHSGGKTTCTEQAKCTVCNAEYDDGIAIGHKLDRQKLAYADSSFHSIPCTRCYQTVNEPHKSVYKNVDEMDHMEVCKDCGADIGTLEHHYIYKWAPIGDVTHTRLCICGYTKEDLHDWSEWEPVSNGESKHSHKCSDCTKEVSADCSFGGYTNQGDNHSKTCDDCGRTVTEKHTGGEPTCTQKAICDVCKNEYNDPNNHTWDDEWSVEGNTHYRVCTDCNKARTDEGEHSGGKPTCTKKAICDFCKNEYGNPNGHTWATKWSVDGDKHYYACANCKERKNEAKHSGGKPTCTKKAICEVCKNEYVNPNGHTWATEWSVDGDKHYYACANCKERKNEAKHSGGIAACTEPGACAVCQAQYISPLGHDPVDHAGQAPTCTAAGCIPYQTCSRCEYTTYAEILAMGHDPIAHAAQSPTCTAAGWDAYQTCSRCEYTTRAEIPALGHDPIAHAAQAPTCTAFGWSAYQACSRCEYTTCVEIPALGHDLIDHATQAPTCTAAGWIAYQTCSRCEYSTRAEILATGHTPAAAVKENESAATCARAGRYDEAVYCAVCGGELGRTTHATPIAAHDHAVSSRTLTRITYRCRACGDSYWTYNAHSRNLIDGLVRDADGKAVDYTAGVSIVNGKRTLAVEPDAADGTLGLYLRLEDMAAWLLEGIETVAFRLDYVTLEIDLAEFTAGWVSPVEGAIDFLAFILAPAEKGAEASVAAVIGEETTAAPGFAGLTLARSGRPALPIAENGVYELP